MAEVITAPELWSNDLVTIFLAGCMDGKWRPKVIEALSGFDVTILDPTREDWDALDDDALEEQVGWEQDGLEAVDLRIFVMMEGLVSPITLMEFGEFLDKPSLVVCEPGHEARPSVEVVCEREGVQLFDSVDEMIEEVSRILEAFPEGIPKTAASYDDMFTLDIHSIFKHPLPAPDKEGQERLFKRPESQEEAEREGIKHASLEPWRNSSYARSIELVPIAELKKYREYNRLMPSQARSNDPETEINEMADSIRNEGIREPLILEYSQSTGRALLTEGNHRLIAAERAGLTEVPVRGYRRYGPFRGAHKGVTPPEKNFGVDIWGDEYVPQDFKPSVIGVGGSSKGEGVDPSEVRKKASVTGPVYHGTTATFEEFNTRRRTVRNRLEDVEEYRMGAYFTDDKQIANEFAGPKGTVITCQLNLNKVLDFRETSPEWLEEVMPWLDNYDTSEILAYFNLGNGLYQALESIDSRESLVPKLKKRGYDGLIIPDSGEGTTYVVFNPRKIVVISKEPGI